MGGSKTSEKDANPVSKGRKYFNIDGFTNQNPFQKLVPLQWYVSKMQFPQPLEDI